MSTYADLYESLNQRAQEFARACNLEAEFLAACEAAGLPVPSRFDCFVRNTFFARYRAGTSFIRVLHDGLTLEPPSLLQPLQHNLTAAQVVAYLVQQQEAKQA